MKKVVITFGLLGGAVIAALVWSTATLVDRDLIGFERLEIVGYTSMLIALSMVFFGIKSFRDNYSGGTITFWKGMQVGMLISLIAGLVYWGSAVSYGVTNPGFEERFMKKFSELKVGQLEQQGAPQEKIDAGKAEVALMQTLFESPILFFLICMVEILPVGLIVTLISAGLLRKKDLLPATA